MMMKKTKLFVFLFLLFLGIPSLSAQNDIAFSLNSVNHFRVKSNQNKEMNSLKLNLSPLLFKNFSMQYERVINKKFSAALSFRFMPNSTLPFKNLISNNYGSDSITEQVIDNFRISNFHFTPEFRIYLGKGYGQGFYIAPYYRYSSFNTKNITFEYDDESNENDQTIELEGKLNMNSVGLMIGAQWFLGKKLLLDWWIIGGQYGFAKGNYTGTTDRTLTSGEQADLKEVLDMFDIPMVDKKVEVYDDGAKLNLKGPVIGLRMGFCLGYRF